MSDKAYAYWLGNVAGIGDKTILRLLQIQKDPQEIYHSWKKAGGEIPKEYKGILTAGQTRALRESINSWDVDAEYGKLREKGIGFLPFFCEEYPGRLKHIPDPPYAIYVRGKLPEETVLSVAVIGARECSEYGRYVGQALGGMLGENGVQVISGMAKGIDGISQEAALQMGGSSFGVLGCGVDICYPAGNRRLYERLLVQGGILSSYPPGTQPRASLFPPRNRIVSGLSDVLVVVEARQQSGTLITVDMALEQGREVYVVPGRLTDRLSDGCNKLIRQGAGIVLSPEEFLREITEQFPGSVPGRGRKCCKKEEALPGQENALPGHQDTLSVQEDALCRKVCEGLDFYPRSIDQIKEAAGLNLPYHRMQQILMRLCLTPYVRQVSPGFYQKNASGTGF